MVQAVQVPDCGMKCGASIIPILKYSIKVPGFDFWWPQMNFDLPLEQQDPSFQYEKSKEKKIEKQKLNKYVPWVGLEPWTSK